MGFNYRYIVFGKKKLPRRALTIQSWTDEKNVVRQHSSS